MSNVVSMQEYKNRKAEKKQVNKVLDFKKPHKDSKTIEPRLKQRIREILQEIQYGSNDWTPDDIA